MNYARKAWGRHRILWRFAKNTVCGPGSAKHLRGAGDFAGWDIFGFFGGWVGGEPGLLVFDELGGFFADVADGFESQLAGEVVGCVLGWLLEVGGPALGGIEELGQGFADVAVVGAVVVEIVVELVGDGGELLEQVVGVLLAAGLAWVGVEILDGFVAGVEELDEDEDAIVGEVGGLAELLDLAFGESVVVR